MSPSPSRTTRLRGRFVMGITVGVAVVGLSGCGAEDPPATAAVTTSSSPATTSTPATTAVSVPVTAAPLAGKSSPTSAPTTSSFVGGTTQVSTPVTPGAFLSNITVSAEAGFDRVVFTFANLLPGHRVGPVSGPFRFDPSDNPVPVVGPDYVEAYFSGGSRADMSTGQAIYTGPDHVAGPPGGVVVTEVVLVGDFEDQLRWIIGTSAPAQYLVSTQTGPFRVVVDLAPQ